MYSPDQAPCPSGGDTAPVDIRDIKIDRQLPIEERLRQFMAQTGDPRRLRWGETPVTLQFHPDGEASLAELIADLLIADRA